MPLTTRYAQEARPYALTTLFAVAATYLLVRAATDGRWPWWTAYAAAVAVTGLFNLFALLLVVAHGLSLLAAETRSAFGRTGLSRPVSSGAGWLPAGPPACCSLRWPCSASGSPPS